MEGGREPLCLAPSAEETLLRCRDLASSLRLLRADCLSTGLELLRRIQERLLAILQHSMQVHGPRGPPGPSTAPALGGLQKERQRRAKGCVETWARTQLLGQPPRCSWALPLSHLASATE